MGAVNAVCCGEKSSINHDDALPVKAQGVLQDQKAEVEEPRTLLAPVEKAPEEAKTEPETEGQEEPKTIVEQIADKVNDVATAVVEAAEDAKEHIAEATKQAAETVKQAVGIDQPKLTIEFVGPKGAVQKVEFETKKVGFSMAAGGKGCCGPKAPPGVVLKAVAKDSPAAKAGCTKGWKVKTVDGVDIESLSQAEKLVHESVEKLPETL